MAAGIIFSLLSAIALNTGNIVQKHAVSSLPSISAGRSVHLFRTLLSSRIWLGGLALCLLGLAFQIMAFALAPIPVVQSIFNAGVVLLIVLSRLRLGERFQRAEWIGLALVASALVALGASLTDDTGVSFGSNSPWGVVAAAGPTLVLVVLVVLTIRRTGSSRSGALFGIAAGLLYGLATLGTKGASTLVSQHGVVASVPLILTSIYPYVFVVFALLAMILYQSGIQRFRIAIVGSMSDVVASTYVVVVGMLVFGEPLPHRPVILALRLIAFVGIITGSLFLALGGRGSAADLPPIDADLGVGEVLVAEVDSLIGRPIEDVVSGVRPTTGPDDA